MALEHPQGLLWSTTETTRTGRPETAVAMLLTAVTMLSCWRSQSDPSRSAEWHDSTTAGTFWPCYMATIPVEVLS